ncbi:hypothetical protein SAMN02745136_05724 [Anaerocolumna jejuensis DSM 15929]|uniref:Uncharacterized protein n=1 Tax=Anaerocolumna jejuensis DSM 15929 TaxID=1121322 RepID=A0A1M7DKC9_9FIRM|nr:hypothetical protein [Anaerocolumna jejuensis]SHL79971.1 hypothetical protein SAMN02745136_05724 [Anaerocolumna jejuensis DSM 15929]
MPHLFSSTYIVEKFNKYKKIVNNFDNRMLGKIIRCNSYKKFIVIENFNSQGDTYLSFLNEFRDFIVIDDDLIERKVEFTPEIVDGKKTAKDVKFV